ncbi:MAG: 2,3-bisphosphoglycerate-dependent phosphoglycerate mutase [Candidatus Levybacteria bacterium]|nr:2,3-bisphosphoglycerate-dependent phosphoglycerate mutase [Candidatus Levybacteria bacterium]
MAILALVRHGESEWNAKGLWTGWTDISLSKIGRDEAKQAAETLRNVQFDVSYTSILSRAKETLEIIKQTIGSTGLKTIESPALNERDYGEFTGKNKWEIEKEVGRENFQKLRRGWYYPIENGETLKDVYERVVPYYRQEILPNLEQGKNVLISAHGNSLRALVKYLDNISDVDISNLEIATGEAVIYEVNSEGKAIRKKVS